MRNIIRFFIKLLFNLIQIYHNIINYIILKSNHVVFDETPRIKGIIFLLNQGNIHLGKKVSINSNWISNPIGGGFKSSIVVTEKDAQLSIGNGSGLSNVSIVCSECIEIGRYVRIGGGTKIYDTDFHSLNVGIRVSPLDKGTTAKVKIDDGVYIGGSCTILKGVTIGEQSVVGASSVVTRDIPAFQVWAGVPAKYIRDLTETEKVVDSEKIYEQ
ncbi:MAG: acyltransferase [bacterium]